MKIDLKKKPKNPIVIEGFPGFGMVGTISTEFLIKHLNAEQIGSIRSDKMVPFAAVHNAKIVEPIGIYYDKKHNIVIIHSLSPIKGLEWHISDAILRLANDLGAKEVISLEAVGLKGGGGGIKSFYYCEDSKKKKAFEKMNIEPLKEGMIMGVTGALLLKKPKLVSSIFVESRVSIGDSKAAAEVIRLLDGYLGLKVDYKPLLRSAKDFEKVLQGIMKKGQQVQKAKTNKKDLDYMG